MATKIPPGIGCDDRPIRETSCPQCRDNYAKSAMGAAEKAVVDAAIELHRVATDKHASAWLVLEKVTPVVAAVDALLALRVTP